jgi:LytS/YehU family sensor histidine kinase
MNVMPARELQEQLDTLREQLEKNPPLSEKEREDLNQLAARIDAQIKLENATQDNSLADNLNLAVERFEVEHPTLAGTLRNIVQTLGNIGI